jgi:hypothetical protein
VKAILSKYGESSLTAADTRAINEAFREAGLRNGPALQQAIRDAGFVPQKIGELDPPPDQPEDNGPADKPEPKRPDRRKAPPDRPEEGRGGGYSIEQAISDRAQLNTIALDALAFLASDFGCNTFLPPGKVADFCGFQYMRDVDTNELGYIAVELRRFMKEDSVDKGKVLALASCAFPPTDVQARRHDLLSRARPSLRAAAARRSRVSRGAQSRRPGLCGL